MPLIQSLFLPWSTNDSNDSDERRKVKGQLPQIQTIEKLRSNYLAHNQDGSEAAMAPLIIIDN